MRHWYYRPFRYASMSVGLNLGQSFHLFHASWTPFWIKFKPLPFPCRLAIIEESQPLNVKNRNLSRLIANLSRQNLSSELTVFIVFQQYFSQSEVPSTCVPRNLPCLVFESSHTFLTYTDRLCSRLVSGDAVLKLLRNLHVVNTRVTSSVRIERLGHTLRAHTSFWHCCIHRIALYNGMFVTLNLFSLFLF